MRATTSPRRAPAGFTLIELLVVISIIGILMGLLLGAVQKVRDVGRRTAVVSEVNQLDLAVTGFKKDFGFNPPHRIRLPGVVPNAATWPGGSVNQQESYAGFQILLQMFPRWQIPGVGSAVAAADSVNSPATAGIAPTGIKFCSTLPVPSVVKANEEGLLLEGSQCLVFFLGGPEQLGFVPSGPYSPPSGTTSTKPPYYEFKNSRMDPSILTRVNSLIGTPDVPNGYLNGYLDPYGTPYAYFSTFTGVNYNSKYAWQPPVVTPAYSLPMRAFQVPKVSNSDPDKWVNSGRVQIVSAGKNKRFGPGTIDKGIPPNTYWVPGGIGYALDAAVPNGDGGDDLANFNAGAQLGVTGN